MTHWKKSAFRTLIVLVKSTLNCSQKRLWTLDMAFTSLGDIVWLTGVKISSRLQGYQNKIAIDVYETK